MNRLVSLGVLAVALVLPAAAQTDPGNGAQIIRTDECQTFEELGTFCQKSLFVMNVTETPSGNISISINQHFENSFSGAGPFAGCQSTTDGRQYEHVLTKQNVIQEQSLLVESHSTENCRGVSIECVVTSHFHSANGQIQFDRQEFNCTDPV